MPDCPLALVSVLTDSIVDGNDVFEETMLARRAAWDEARRYADSFDSEHFSKCFPAMMLF